MKINYQLRDNGLNVSIADAKQLLTDGMQAKRKEDKDTALFGAYYILNTISNLIDLSFENVEQKNDFKE